MKETDQTMACQKGSAHNYQWNDKQKKVICLNCGHIALYQPIPGQAVLLEKYQILLGKCQELVAGEMSYNQFVIFIENE